MATSTAAPARPETHARQIFRTRDLRIRLGVHDQREFRHAWSGFLPQVGRFVVEYRMRGLRGVMNFVGGLFKAGCRCGGDAPPQRENVLLRQGRGGAGAGWPLENAPHTRGFTQPLESTPYTRLVTLFHVRARSFPTGWSHRTSGPASSPTTAADPVAIFAPTSMQTSHFRRHQPSKRLPIATSSLSIRQVARVAQLDRASASGAEGCGFDPRLAYQLSLAVIRMP